MTPAKQESGEQTKPRCPKCAAEFTLQDSSGAKHFACHSTVYAIYADEKFFQSTGCMERQLAAYPALLAVVKAAQELLDELQLLVDGDDGAWEAIDGLGTIELAETWNNHLKACLSALPAAAKIGE